MNNKKRKLNLGLLYIIISIFVLPIKGHAEIGDISVQAILPENQHNKDVSYYDLRVNPGDVQDVELAISNVGDKEQTVTVDVTDARTGRNGDFDYSVDKEYKKDSSLSTGLTDIASAPKTVTIPPKGTTKIPIHLELPKESFDGMVLGGIVVTQAKEETDTKKQKSGMQIENTVSLIVGMKLTETDNPVKAELNFIGAKASQDGGKNQGEITLQNKMPINLEKIDYTAKIYKKGKQDVLHERSVSDYRFAPNSSFIFPVSWENEPFESGMYQVDMTAKSKETGQEWHWNEEFEITADDAKKLNDKAIDLKKAPLWPYIVIGIIVLLVLLVLLLLILRHRKKKQEAERKKKKMKKRKQQPEKKNVREKGTQPKKKRKQ